MEKLIKIVFENCKSLKNKGIIVHTYYFVLLRLIKFYVYECFTCTYVYAPCVHLMFMYVRREHLIT